MAKVALLTLHGMGETDNDYARSLITGLRKRMDGVFDAHVAVFQIDYQKVLQPNQDYVWNRVKQLGRVHYDEMRKFLLFGISDAAGLENGKEQVGSVYEEAQIEIARALFQARGALGGDGPVVVISQSLGGQVLSNYLYDAQKAAATGHAAVGIWRDIDAHANTIAGRALSTEEKAFLGGGTLRRWLSTGCNIPIFVAAHKSMSIKPIAKPTADFRWLNLYDPDDVLGWPLAPLSDGYAALVEDRVINSGDGLVNWIVKSWNPMSHTAYWDDADVLRPLEAMLREFV